MKKTVICFFLVFLLFTLLSFSVHAAEASVVAEGAEVLPDTSGESLPLVGSVAAFLQENSSTLLGLLTFLGSLLVAFFYKMGLLPMLRSGLSALGELLGKSTRLTESFTKSAEETFSRIESATAPLLTIAKDTEAALSALEARIATLSDDLEKAEADRALTAEVLRTETELFYEMLHSVNLPEAQKESMTESYYRMKRLLEAEK